MTIYFIIREMCQVVRVKNVKLENHAEEKHENVNSQVQLHRKFEKILSSVSRFILLIALLQVYTH